MEELIVANQFFYFLLLIRNFVLELVVSDHKPRHSLAATCISYYLDYVRSQDYQVLDNKYTLDNSWVLFLSCRKQHNKEIREVGSLLQPIS